MKLAPRHRSAVLALACLATVVGLCSAWFSARGHEGDADLAGKYRAAAASIAHVSSVDAEYGTYPSLGRMGKVIIHADTEDLASMREIMRRALPAIAEADPAHNEASLMVRVVAVAGGSVVIPDALGFPGDGSGSGTLSAFRRFVLNQGL